MLFEQQTGLRILKEDEEIGLIGNEGHWVTEVLLWGLNNVHLILGVSITVLHSLTMMFFVLIHVSSPYSSFTSLFHLLVMLMLQTNEYVVLHAFQEIISIAPCVTTWQCWSLALFRFIWLRWVGEFRLISETFPFISTRHN